MRLLVFYLIGLLFILHDGHCAGLGDAVGELFKAATGAMEAIPKSIPTPKEFFNLSKNTFIGLPYVVVYKLINQFCT